MKIDWKAAVLVFIFGLATLSSVATFIAVCIGNFASAAVFALFATVLAALTAGLYVGGSDEQNW